MYQYYLKKRTDGEYDLIIQIDRHEAEFGLDFFTKRSERSAYDKFVKYLTSQNRKIKIKSIHIVVSGLLVAVIPFTAPTIAAAKNQNLSAITSSIMFAAEKAIQSGNKFHMTYLYGGTVAQQIAQVEMVGSFQTVSYTHLDVYKRQLLFLKPVNKDLL